MLVLEKRLDAEINSKGGHYLQMMLCGREVQRAMKEHQAKLPLGSQMLYQLTPSLTGPYMLNWIGLMSSSTRGSLLRLPN
jgi:hypothetical protein